MLFVKKFGGTSVANAECIYRVANRCLEDYQKGHNIVLVLSAMGKYTDELIAKAMEINPDPSNRELDMLLTIGEQMSVSLMAMAFEKLGVPAVSLNAFQAGIYTTDQYSNAEIIDMSTRRIRTELSQRKIVIVTGFQGVDIHNNLTTLGRGGSDTTAVALAAALDADACEIYTDVDGVYTADPRIVPNAKKLNRISFDVMLELAASGAGVLHDRCVKLAQEHQLVLVVRSSMSLAEGTEICDRDSYTCSTDCGLAIQTNGDGFQKTSCISIVGDGIMEHEEAIRNTEAYLNQNHIPFQTEYVSEQKITISVEEQYGHMVMNKIHEEIYMEKAA